MWAYARALHSIVKIEVFAECGGFVDTGIEYMGQIEFDALKWCVRIGKKKYG